MKYTVTLKLTAYATVVVDADNEDHAEEVAINELEISSNKHIQQDGNGTSLTIIGNDNTLNIDTDDLEIDSVEKL